MLKLALILPCYNESKNLSKICDGFLQSAKVHGFTPHSFRLVLVDNGSTDDTQAVMNRFIDEESTRRNWIQMVHVPENLGYGHGIAQGLQACDSAFSAWSHADGQCSPEDVFLAFGRACLSPNTMVKGRRIGRTPGAWIFSRAFDLAVWIGLRKALYDINAQPKVFPRALTKNLEGAPKGFAFDLFVLLRAREMGISIKTVPVYFSERLHGESHWSSSMRSRVLTVRVLVRFIVDYALARKLKNA